MEYTGSGHAYKYEPKWEKDIDYSPDHHPSTSSMYIEDRLDGSTVWIFAVRGLGAIVMRAAYEDEGSVRSLQFKGVSIFDKGEIGYTPQL